MHIKLNNNYSLGVEPHLKNGVRLIVFNNGTEFVCRKEKLRKLSQFIQLDEGHLFKGRLQLFKYQDTVAVEVKGNHIGTISSDIFKYSLSQVY